MGLRGWLLTGPRGWQIGLDQCRGVARATITDCENANLSMRKGVAIVEVWGGDRHEVARVVEEHETSALAMVLVWREAGVLTRAWSRVRWMWWRARMVRPWGWLPMWGYRRLPRWVMSSPPAAGPRTPGQLRKG